MSDSFGWNLAIVAGMLLKYKPRPPRELKRTEPKPPPPRWASLREQIMEEFESSAIRRKLSDVRP